MGITFFSTKPYDTEYLLVSNKNDLKLHFIEESLSISNYQLAKGSDMISVFTNDDVSDVLLEKLKEIGVRYIATRSAGYDHINITKAETLGIGVANVPSYSPYSIAEHAIAMILALNRKLIKADQKIKNHNFLLDDLIGFDLNGKTVGIIGTGKIGGIVAKILNGFGCKILAFDLYPNEIYTQDYGVKYVSLDTLYACSDIITLHCPLNSNTKYLINEVSINKMKDGVMIINTGRGGIIDTKALIQGLKNNKIGSVGLDVYENEKGLFFHNHEHTVLQDDLFARLLAFSNVFITGHQSFLTKEALTNIADATIYNLTCFAQGIPSKNQLTKSLILNNA